MELLNSVVLVGMALYGTQIVSMNNVSNFEVINSINYSTNTGNAGTGMLNGNFVMSKILDASTTFTEIYH
jgi:hypothetical protein